jgi:pectate lyase C
MKKLNLTMLILGIMVLCAASIASAANVTISTTITVNATTYNGSGNTIICTGMGDGSQNESQSPVFKIINGTVSNVKIGFPGCDGIHMYGKGTISGVSWLDIGEDAATCKSGKGPFLITGGSTTSGSDKDFQSNATNATFTVTGHTVTNVLKVIRQCGGHTDVSTFKVSACNLNTIKEAVIRVDKSTSPCTVTGCTLNNVKCLIEVKP